MQKILFRQMREADVKEVGAVIKACFDPIFGKTPLKKNIAYARYLWGKRLPGVCFVATSQHRIVGCVVASKWDDFWNPKIVVICALGVLADYRRRGVAEGLLKRVFSAARKRGLSTLVLKTGSRNEPAKALYKKAGFALDRIWLKRRV